nr:beta-ribofuranosylaminobenzene 5'-phosphate synthase family protein [Ancylobacter gelatini]
MRREETPVNETTLKRTAAPDSERDATIRVVAPARLHLGFLDLAGTLGRRFGSLGLTLERPCLVLRLRPSPTLDASGPDADRARRAAEKALGWLGISGGADITIDTALPPHAGLGSGTQLALAVSAGMAALHRRDMSLREIGAALGRGARSAIGIGAFTEGGFLLDGGKKLNSQDNSAPPLLARHAFPSHWRVILAYDHGHSGLSGTDEVTAMDTLPPFPDSLAGHLARLTLMQALPALVEEEIGPFGAAIGEIQHRLGEHYAQAQGGRYTSAAVGEAMGWLESQGIAGVGQSSWGPTGFAFIGDAAQAERLLDALRQRYAGHATLRFDCVRGRNAGAQIERLAPSPAA